MRRPYRSAAIAALMSLACAVPASATIFTITWQGTLDSGTYTVDSNPTLDIAGLAFTVVYTVDDSLGTDNSTPPEVASLFGGPGFGVATSPVSAQVTLEGIGTFALAGNDLSSASRVNYAPVSTFPDAASYRSDDQIEEVVGGVDHHRTASVFSFLTETDPALHGTLFDSIAYDALPVRVRAASDQSVFAFQWNDILTDLTSLETSQIFIQAGSASGWIVSSTAVPEPASWALMIGGFALAGAAMRRRAVIVRFA
jgi:hypothetical protein